MDDLTLKIIKCKEEAQNEFIEKLASDVECLLEKAMKKSYTPTPKERMTFERIKRQLNNASNWF